MSEHLMRVYDCEEDMQKLLDYIFGHDISLCLGLMEETEKVLSAESFRRVIKQVLGENYDFLYIETAHYSFGQVYYVDIIHTKKHYSVGCIYGCPSQAYLRGDSWESPLTFYYAVSNGKVFLRNQKVASVCRADQIYCGPLGDDYPFCVIDIKTGLIKKYMCDGSLVWTNKIEKNHIRAFRFEPGLRRLTGEFPIGLTVISDGTTLLYYRGEDGEFYGEYAIKKEYERIS